ncbi:MAG: methionyl-tRNA formyltransferase [Treponema sp.]|nr:methionyl-tRNA formyltransferase [Treponema sp.]
MLKVLYAGSPEVSAKTLSLLLENQTAYKIVGVLSNPASAKGRHKTPIPTPVSNLAIKNNIPLYTPEHLDAVVRADVENLNPDVLVCFAYGHIFGPKFLSLFKYGGINLHPSLLPKYRGPTPVNAAILNGDTETAVTVQSLSLKMDEGDILSQEIIKLDGTETSGSLLDFCAEKGARLILKVLEDCEKNKSLPKGRVQEGIASYTKIITKDDCKIDWQKTSFQIDSHIRAYFPEPCAWTIANGNLIKILECKKIDKNILEKISKSVLELSNLYDDEPSGKVLSFQKEIGIIVKTGSDALAITKLQRQGKTAMDASSFMNGARNFIGTILE